MYFIVVVNTENKRMNRTIQSIIVTWKNLYYEDETIYSSISSKFDFSQNMIQSYLSLQKHISMIQRESPRYIEWQSLYVYKWSLNVREQFHWIEYNVGIIQTVLFNIIASIHSIHVIWWKNLGLLWCSSGSVTFNIIEEMYEE